MSAPGPSAAPPAASGPPAYFATGWTGGRNPWLIALVVTMATFMEILDASIANVSLPHMAGNLSVSQDESTWVLTSYLVANAVVLPISGWLASRFGRKRFYMTCVAIFTAASFMCGLAPTLGTLIVCRVIQGLGGGGLGPSEQSILVDTFPMAKRGMAMAVYGMAVVLAPAIGPTLGGFITDTLNWRWVFFINIPVGLLSLYLTRRIVTDPPHLRDARERARTIRVDWVGLGLVAVGLGALEVVLDKGLQEDWFHSSFITGFAIVAALALVSFVVWELQHPNPIVDLKLFKLRSFAVSNAMMLILGAVLFGSTMLLPQYMQLLMGYTAQQSGMALSPGGLVVIALLPLVGRLVTKVDTRALLMLGFSVMSASLFYMTFTINLQMDFGTAVALRMFQSLGLAFLFVPIQTIAYGEVPLPKSNQVSGILNLSRMMGGSIGIALVTTLIGSRAQLHQAQLAAHTSAYDLPFLFHLQALAATFSHAGAGALQQATAVLYRQLVTQATQLAYLDALFVMAVGTAVIAPLVWVAKRPPQRR